MKNQKGMTLVELMVAVVIITLALTTMLNIFDLGLNTITKAQKETQALQYAQQLLEESKNMINEKGSFTSDRLTKLPAGYQCVIPENYPYLDQEKGLWHIKVIVRYDNGTKEVVLVTKLGVRDD